MRIVDVDVSPICIPSTAAEFTSIPRYLILLSFTAQKVHFRIAQASLFCERVAYLVILSREAESDIFRLIAPSLVLSSAACVSTPLLCFAPVRNILK